jgi:hypothetical protein
MEENQKDEGFPECFKIGMQKKKNHRKMAK